MSDKVLLCHTLSTEKRWHVCAGNPDKTLQQLILLHTEAHCDTLLVDRDTVQATLMLLNGSFLNHDGWANHDPQWKETEHAESL